MVSYRPRRSTLAVPGSSQKFIDKARSLNPDVILLDLMMPEKTGIEAIEEIKQKTPMPEFWF